MNENLLLFLCLTI